MNRPSPAQLAAMELRLCELAHPRWLTDAAVRVDDDAQGARRPLPAAAAISRWLVDRHALAPLTPAAFTRCWSYAVLGGQDAVATLRQQTTAYCTARWVRSTVDGVRLRLLVDCIGAAAYDDALRRAEPAQHWLPPHDWPADVAGFLQAQIDLLMQALWSRCATALAPWARLMAPPADSADRIAGWPPSHELIDEVDALLQRDFALDFDDAGSTEVGDDPHEGNLARTAPGGTRTEASALA